MLIREEVKKVGRDRVCVLVVEGTFTHSQNKQELEFVYNSVLSGYFFIVLDLNLVNHIDEFCAQGIKGLFKRARRTDVELKVAGPCDQVRHMLEVWGIPHESMFLYVDQAVQSFRAIPA